MLSFYIQSVLGSEKDFKLKTSRASSPPTKNTLYGAMLGAMCEMYGGKRVGETLAWEEVLSFYTHFVLGSAQEFKLKTSNALGTQPQKSFVWCHVGDNVRDVWEGRGWGSTGLGGSAVFLHSVCAWASKGI